MKASLLTVASILIPIAAFAQNPSTQRDASDLLAVLLSPQTSDSQWSAAEKSFETLPPSLALPVLFPEMAKGIPGGYSYAAYNCFDPQHDRKVSGWGQFCVVNSLWCKQLACPHRKKEVSKGLLDLWANPISEYGQLVLLEGLCGNPDAESRIAVLFHDSAANVRLRTQAAICLLRQAEPKYHAEVVAFAQQAQKSPIARMKATGSHQPGRCRNTNTRGSANGALMEMRSWAAGEVPGMSMCRAIVLYQSASHANSPTANAT